MVKFINNLIIFANVKLRLLMRLISTNGPLLYLHSVFDRIKDNQKHQPDNNWIRGYIRVIGII